MTSTPREAMAGLGDEAAARASASVRPATEMELRVARALHEGWLPTWEQCARGELQYRVEQAKRAIRAMREPPANVACHGSDIATWRAMIDAASPPELSPSPPTVSSEVGQ